MKTLTCIVVDDQSFAINLLKDHISKTEELKLISTFTNPLAVKTYLSNNDGIDILFTDVDMPDISGIELAEKVYSKIKHLVFVTSHFKKDIQPNIDGRWYYLSKPTGFEIFKKVVLEIFSLTE